MELNNNTNEQGIHVDPVTLEPLIGEPPDYDGTILVGQTRYNPNTLETMIEHADLAPNEYSHAERFFHDQITQEGKVPGVDCDGLLVGIVLLARLVWSIRS